MPGFGVGMGVLGASTLKVRVLPKAGSVSGALTHASLLAEGPRGPPYWGHSILPVCAHQHTCTPALV